MNTSGVFTAIKKDGTKYYRASVTNKEKHISLGSFKSEKAAGAAYALATEILKGSEEYLPEDYDRVLGSGDQEEKLAFDKWIMLLNLRKTGMYCKNPIYLYGKYFVYYLERNLELTFDADEFFFFQRHKLQKRGGHLFYSDFGMQCSLLARYGVKSFAVEGRDYIFKNGNNRDFRNGNLFVINKYNGVYVKEEQGRKKYDVKIHVMGNVSVGTYTDEVEAAIAYNKAADRLEEAVRKKKNNRRLNSVSTNVENNILGKRTIETTNPMGEQEDQTTGKDGMIINENIGKNTKNAAVSALDKDGAKGRNSSGSYRNWRRNYIENLSSKEYFEVYEKLRFSKKFKKYIEKM